MQHGKILLTATMLLSLNSLNAQANLYITGGGLGVYDSGINATWTRDANLLGSWEGAYQSTSYNNIVTAIINASSGVIHDTPNGFDPTGTYTLTAADFGSGGTVDWWAGLAFVNYLDTQHYAGSSQWALPSTPDTVPSYGYNQTDSQLGELFYNELGGTASNPIPSGPFSNVQSLAYWSGTEFTANPSLAPTPYLAWNFLSYNGFQDINFKNAQFSVWAVSPGSIAAVPEANIIYLFGTGLLGLLGLKRRGTIK
ncbi:DUF1566 domain-containing protein [Methylomonas paludis]|uniref:DUF1566 domain-containing protein n=1 Tax=Methylomonas paludis TaxID=1173101 RepID=A0A975MR27_9GAMM|nr:DUF1566 domain-containing protein [Methylomonas paludis]QWF72240.1 DUF1566 domain-containing protein [Methylomonas paludis]